MYGHEVLICVQTQAKLIGTQFLHSHVSDFRLWQMIVYSIDKHCQNYSLPISCQIWTMLTLQSL
jgi:hypothetical protein